MKYRYAFIAFFVAYLIQSTLAIHISIFGIAPNLVLVLVIVFSFLYDEKFGIIFGIIFGFILDISFSPVIGASALAYFLVALLIKEIRRNLYRDNLFSVLFISVVGTLTYSFVQWGFLKLFGNNYGILYVLQNQIVLIIYNAIFVLLVYRFIVKHVIKYRGDRYM